MLGEDPSKIDVGIWIRRKSGFDGKFCRALKGETDKHRDFTYGVHTTRGVIMFRVLSNKIG